MILDIRLSENARHLGRVDDNPNFELLANVGRKNRNRQHRRTKTDVQRELTEYKRTEYKANGNLFILTVLVVTKIAKRFCVKLSLLVKVSFSILS